MSLIRLFKKSASLFAFILCLTSKVSAITPLGVNQFNCELQIEASIPRQTCGNSLSEEVQLNCSSLPANAEIKGIFNGADVANNFVSSARKVGSVFYIKLLEALSKPGANEILFRFSISDRIYDLRFRVVIDTFGPLAQLTLVNNQLVLHAVDSFSQIGSLTLLDLSTNAQTKIYSYDQGVNPEIAESVGVSPRDMQFALKDITGREYLLRTVDVVGNQNLYKLTNGTLRLWERNINDPNPFEEQAAPAELSTVAQAAGANHDANGIGLVAVINTLDWQDTGPAEEGRPLEEIISGVKNSVERAVDELSQALAKHSLDVPGFAEVTKRSVLYYVRDVRTEMAKEVLIDRAGGFVLSDESVAMPFTGPRRVFHGDAPATLHFEYDLAADPHMRSFAEVALTDAYSKGHFGSWPKSRNRVLKFFDNVESKGVRFTNYLLGMAPAKTQAVIADAIHPAGTLSHELLHTFGLTHAGWAMQFNIDHNFNLSDMDTTANIMDYRATNQDRADSLTRSQAINFLQRVYGKPDGQHAVPWQENIREISSGTQHFDEPEWLGAGQQDPPLTFEPFNREIFAPRVGGDYTGTMRFPFDSRSPLAASTCLESAPGVKSLLAACVKAGFSDQNHMIAEGSNDWRFLLPGDIDPSTGLPRLRNSRYSTTNLDFSAVNKNVFVSTIPVTQGVFNAWDFTTSPPLNLARWYRDTATFTATLESPFRMNTRLGRKHSVVGEAGHYSIRMTPSRFQENNFLRNWPRNNSALLREGGSHFVAIGVSDPSVGVSDRDSWGSAYPTAPEPIVVLP